MHTIYPVIMCGGSGTRMWPLSRKTQPKQYHAVVTPKTMLQETIARVKSSDGLNVAGPSFVCGKTHEDIIREQCLEAGVTPHRIILEPEGRNTAPVAAIISDLILSDDPNGLILLMPADHHIADEAEFARCLRAGIAAATSEKLATFGIQPTGPETGFGYIKAGQPLMDEVFAVSAFVEKPDFETAKSYLASGDYFWNAGIFLFAPQSMITAFEVCAPDILKDTRTAIAQGSQNGTSLLLGAAAFAACRDESIDYAIMEQADNVVVVSPVNVGWNDIGSWAAVRDFTNDAAQAEASPEVGDVISLDCENSFIRSDGPIVAAIGLKDMIVVVHEGAVLVMPADRSQDVKQIVQKLKADKRADKL